ncbi:MAG TPA: NDMA-dependent alcohol dehydrogenase, partial [Microthrixaceae bacterium]|nr:NDMA-dependent alcohol dehydrogenase [Microthrixaceae bacterium]
AGEVLVEVTASGMCHSDDHARTGDLAALTPLIGGHEGAGVVLEVGEGVTTLSPGDHVVFSFVPACGRCPSCADGHSNLCDNGAALLMGLQLDGTSRHHARGQDLYTMVCLGTFAKHTVVNEMSCVKVEDDIPLELACLVGCGVTTGWGSSVYAGEVKPGDNVAVIGVGGIGAAAVQGARLAGARQIIAIDPVEFKREQAMKFGATHTAASIGEAYDLINQITWGRMCDKVICCMGVGKGDQIAPIMTLTAKRGRVVVTNIHSMAESSINISLVDLTLMEKQLVGTIFGSANPQSDIPRLMHLFRNGQLDLAGMVTREYALEDINEGFADMLGGKNIRGVLRYV